jgi:hypothetical protein
MEQPTEMEKVEGKVYRGDNRFSGKRIRQCSKKLAAIKKRDKRLRKVTKEKYSILSFNS